MDIVVFTPSIMDNSPIGIFDSGLGGLSVWREVQKQLPNEQIIYFADSLHCPYGRKKQDEIIDLSCSIVDKLISLGCKLIVVACNTATAAAIDVLRHKYQLPFVGMEPAIKQAALHTQTKRVAVLATKGTFDGRLYKATSEKYAHDIDVMVQIGDGLVELVETNRYETDDAYNLLKQYVEPMVKNNVDQIVLGCTHYPFFKPQIEKIVGNNVTVIDPAPAVVKHVNDILLEYNIKSNASEAQNTLFISSSSIQNLQQLVQSLSNKSIVITQTKIFDKNYNSFILK